MATTKYFYAINKDNIQQIDDDYSAYALDRVEDLNNYFCGICNDGDQDDTYHPLVLDGVTICGDNGHRNFRTIYWMCYIIPKYVDEIIYVYNPDADNPAYILGGAPTGDITYAYGCLEETEKNGNGGATGWTVYDYKVKDRIVDVTDPSKATADVIYVWGGHLLYYDKRPTTDQIVNAVAERKAVADKLKILRFRQIKDIADKLDPFGLAIYNDKGELIYTVDGNGKNYQMDDYYLSPTYIAGTYYTGKTPEHEYCASKDYDNVAVMPVGHPWVTEGFGLKGHPDGVDPSRLYPLKLTRHRWSVSQLSGCGVEPPSSVSWTHPDSHYPLNIYDNYHTTHHGATQYYYYKDLIDGECRMLSRGRTEVMTMDCTRYL